MEKSLRRANESIYGKESGDFSLTTENAVPVMVYWGANKEFAHVLSARKFDTEFSTNFLLPHADKKHSQDLRELAGKAAEFLTETFCSVYTNCSESTGVPITTTQQKNHFDSMPTFSCKLDQRSLPLGFSTVLPPSADLICDYLDCSSSYIEDDAVLLNCGHSFHTSCLSQALKEGSCIYCLKF
eukprot:m.242152 g.242152  ORF g.242152 m.242152 type:complete len:184 (+) comp40212_c0_seq2:232-783(+)